MTLMPRQLLCTKALQRYSIAAMNRSMQDAHSSVLL